MFNNRNTDKIIDRLSKPEWVCKPMQQTDKTMQKEIKDTLQEVASTLLMLASFIERNPGVHSGVESIKLFELNNEVMDYLRELYKKK